MNRQPTLIADLPAIHDHAGRQVRVTVLNKLAAQPERYLAEYLEKFGNVFNAADAATLFEEYNSDRAANRTPRTERKGSPGEKPRRLHGGG